MHLNNWPFQADYNIRYTSIKQVENIGTNAWLLDEGQIHRMNVNGPCNCQPHKIEYYGEGQWDYPFQLLKIPNLPHELFNMFFYNRTKTNDE